MPRQGALSQAHPDFQSWRPGGQPWPFLRQRPGTEPSQGTSSACRGEKWGAPSLQTLLLPRMDLLKEIRTEPDSRLCIPEMTSWKPMVPSTVWPLSL